MPYHRLHIMSHPQTPHGRQHTKLSWADPEGGCRGSGPPLKNHKNIGFLSNTGPDPPENHKASNWAIIGTPAKCHLNGVSLVCLC